MREKPPSTGVALIVRVSWTIWIRYLGALCNLSGIMGMRDSGEAYSAKTGPVTVMNAP